MEFKPLPVGVDSYSKLIKNGYYFVDKTLLIKELLDRKGEVNLFTRPRRFGKTLMLSMLRFFFEDMRDDSGGKIDNRGLFEGMRIMQTGEAYLSHMGQYPVISLTLKDTGKADFKQSYEKIRVAVADEFRRHSFILTSEKLSMEKERYEAIMYERAELGNFDQSLKFLTFCLEKYYGKKTIVLIDEYDVPLQRAYSMGYYAEMLEFVRTLLSSLLKTNESLEFAIITGCLRIAKESIFTGLNNPNIISILNKQYDEYFGFTEEEVKKLCDDYGMGHCYDTIKEWYNGYVFGKANVYNPWSVIKYMYDLVDDPDMHPTPYWANTSSNEIVRTLIERADISVRQEIEHLIAGGTIEKPVHEDITYGEIYENMDNLWNFMFFTGYLRKVSERTDKTGREFYLTMVIPNEEVRCIFVRKISEWFKEKVRTRDLSVLYTAIAQKDTQTAEREISSILMHTISIPDQNENYYHGIVAGLLTGMPGYAIESNRESGSGRSDLFILPLSRREEAFVVEFKKADRIRFLETKADEALQQIEDRKYKMQVYDRGYDRISSYGIAFCGKDCLVKWREADQYCVGCSPRRPPIQRS